jgi:hypothetical protein
VVETNSPDGATQRQVVSIGDTATAAAVAKINNATPGSSDYGVTVRTVAGQASLPMRIDPVGTTVQPVSGSINQVPATSGGLPHSFHLVSAGSTNANNVKASPGQVYGWSIFNNAVYPVYVKLYDTAGTPTAGTGVVQTIGVQAGTGRDFSLDSGIAFGTGIGLTITKGIADSDATAVLASDCVVDLFYK